MNSPPLFLWFAGIKMCKNDRLFKYSSKLCIFKNVGKRLYITVHAQVQLAGRTACRIFLVFEIMWL